MDPVSLRQNTGEAEAEAYELFSSAENFLDEIEARMARETWDPEGEGYLYTLVACPSKAYCSHDSGGPC